MNRRQKNEEIRRAFENMQTVRRDGHTLHIVQGRFCPEYFLVTSWPVGLLLVKSGGNVHKATARALCAMQSGAYLRPLPEGPDKETFALALDTLEARR